LNAVIAVLGSVAVGLGFSTAVLGLISQRRIARAAAVADATAAQVQTISVNVDGRLSTLIERQAQLLGVLHAEGVPIPEPPPAAAPVPVPETENRP
jgi:hypothetical protein